ncbi:MAG: flavodoxin family protein, partial [Acidimicrobiia bacterium]
VVYESLYGNTKMIAEAVARGLERHGPVSVSSVPDIAGVDLEEIDLLVVGAPTHAWSLPRQRTWEGAPNRVPGAAPLLVRQWLEIVPDGQGRTAAAFATRIDKSVRITGTAARRISRRLRRRGWTGIIAPESFLVDGTEGPLIDGEIARAVAWGERVGALRAGLPHMSIVRGSAT